MARIALKSPHRRSMLAGSPSGCVQNDEMPRSLACPGAYGGLCADHAARRAAGDFKHHQRRPRRRTEPAGLDRGDLQGRRVHAQCEIWRQRPECARCRDHREPDGGIAARADLRRRPELCQRRRSTFRKSHRRRGAVPCRASRHGRRQGELPAGARQPLARGREGRFGRNLLGASERRPVQRRRPGDHCRRLVGRRVPSGDLSRAQGIPGSRQLRRRHRAGVGHLPRRCRDRRRRQIIFRDGRQQI